MNRENASGGFRCILTRGSRDWDRRRGRGREGARARAGACLGQQPDVELLLVRPLPSSHRIASDGYAARHREVPRDATDEKPPPGSDGACGLARWAHAGQRRAVAHVAVVKLDAAQRGEHVAVHRPRDPQPDELAREHIQTQCDFSSCVVELRTGSEPAFTRQYRLLIAQPRNERRVANLIADC